MATRNYWRGYIDAAAKVPWDSSALVITSKEKLILKPLARLLETEVHKYRSGYRIELPKNYEEILPQIKDRNYLRGWFAARGKRYENDKRLTISGANVEEFIRAARKYGLKLPPANQPSIDSDMLRVIVTGDRARALVEFLDN